MKRIPAAVAILFILTLSCTWTGRKATAPAQEPQQKKDTVYPLGFCTDSFRVVDGKVPEGATFSGLMGSLGLSGEDTYKLIQASDSFFDVRKFRAGNSWKAFYEDSTSLKYLVYQENRVRSIVFQCRDSLAAWPYDKEVIHQEKVADVTINSSLWVDMLEAGASPLIIVELADIYAWTVDFFGLQKGDRFRVLYHQDVCEDEVFRITDVEYAVFSRGDKDAHALYFDQGDGGNKYWNEKGESMRKAFLKAPLKFTRISGGEAPHGHRLCCAHRNARYEHRRRNRDQPRLGRRRRQHREDPSQFRVYHFLYAPFQVCGRPEGRGPRAPGAGDRLCGNDRNGYGPAPGLPRIQKRNAHQSAHDGGPLRRPHPGTI